MRWHRIHRNTLTPFPKLIERQEASRALANLSSLGWSDDWRNNRVKIHDSIQFHFVPLQIADSSEAESKVTWLFSFSEGIVAFRHNLLTKRRLKTEMSRNITLHRHNKCVQIIIDSDSLDWYFAIYWDYCDSDIYWFPLRFTHFITVESSFDHVVLAYAVTCHQSPQLFITACLEEYLAEKG